MANPRIIAGRAKGMRLKTVPGDITRPITDRAKESLFNILTGNILDSKFLDLFGGTGSVGIEALSRGAAFVQFIDKNIAACKTIAENLIKTGYKNQAKILRMDAFTFIKSDPTEKFDYLFIAPPQYQGLWSKMVELIDINSKILESEAWIIVQIDPKEYRRLELNNLDEFDKRKYGNTQFVFYRFRI